MDLIMSPSDQQDAFQKMASPVLDAMPKEATAADIANILAAIVTDFVTVREDIHGIFSFGMHIAFAEAERLNGTRTLQ